MKYNFDINQLGIMLHLWFEQIVKEKKYTNKLIFTDFWL